jgi:hypothetical protein
MVVLDKEPVNAAQKFNLLGVWERLRGVAVLALSMLDEYLG